MNFRTLEAALCNVEVAAVGGRFKTGERSRCQLFLSCRSNKMMSRRL